MPLEFWREEINYTDDYYFCMTKTGGLKGKNRKNIKLK